MAPEFPLSKRVFNFYPGIKAIHAGMRVYDAWDKFKEINVPKEHISRQDPKVAFGEILYYGGTVGHKWGTYVIVD